MLSIVLIITSMAAFATSAPSEQQVQPMSAPTNSTTTYTDDTGFTVDLPARSTPAVSEQHQSRG